jgi:tripartite-type tricarboxylate transporter receptor subunit TctC
MLAPRGVPPAIIAKVNADMRTMMTDPAFAKKLTDGGQEPTPTTPEELTRFMKEETARFSKIIKAAGVTAQ